MKIWASNLTSIALLLLASAAEAQQTAVKSNLLADATLSPNLGVEYAFAPRWSFDLTGELNAWTVGNDKRWKHWAVQPEVRRWLCDPFNGHFFAAHLFGGQYNIGHIDNSIHFLGTNFKSLSDTRVQGWMIGAGVGYGYSWILSRHWNLEAELAVGYAYTRYDRFECRECGRKIESDRSHNYVGPTKAAVNLIYQF
jgi:hypothetical protein